MNSGTGIAVNSGSSIRELQNSFNNFFPYLRLEFLKYKNESGSNNHYNKLTADLKVSHVKPGLSSSELMIKDSMTVEELEKAFRELFGLNVEVLRKSGNIWLETNFTHDWTLHHQNEMGRAIS